MPPFLPPSIEVFLVFLTSLLEARSLLEVRERGGEGAAREGFGAKVGEVRGVLTEEGG